MATMNISLPKEMAKQVEDKVEAGQYSSASELVRAALRLLIERERKLEWLGGEIRKGFDEIDRGQGIPYSSELFEQIKADGRKQVQSRTKKESA